MGTTTDEGTTLRTLIDNRPGNHMLDALRRLMGGSKKLDVATGYFEVGSLLDLDGHWQALEGIRLLMGDEMTRRTKAAFVEALQDNKSNGIERVKSGDDWRALDGLKAIKAALQNGHLNTKVYTKAKFHAKAYHFKTGGIVNHGLIGSSNFTHPGLTQNLELNLFTSDNSQLKELQNWFDEAWAEAEEVRAELLEIIEPHVREYHPFEIYLQAMREYFAAHEPDDSGWERTESRLYHPVLAQYQRDAYNDLMNMAKEYGGGLLCDVVGLGKTFVALMLVERARHERQKVLVIAPKAAIPSVWVKNLTKYFPEDFGKFTDDIRVIPHTDFGRQGGLTDEDIAALRRRYDTIIVDEAHHFRVPSRNRSRKLKALTKDKTTFLLTATPINNSVIDLYNLINFVSQDRHSHFQRVGVPHLRNWFNKALAEGEKQQLEMFEDATISEFLKHIIVQRSRKYIKGLEKQEDENVKFPVREMPEIIDYSLEGVYGSLLPQIIRAFDTTKGKLKLVVYETEKYKVANRDQAVLNEQSQVVGLVRTMLLKRLESSQAAFLASVEDLLLKHVMVLKDLQPMKHEVWITEHEELYKNLEQNRRRRFGNEDDEEEDELPLTTYEARKLASVKEDIKSFGKNEPVWIKGIEGDIEVLSEILSGLYTVTSPEQDQKLKAFIAKIEATPRLVRDKFVVFSEFKDTARYLETELKKRFGDDGIVEVDSGRNVNNREGVIKRFAPYYNCENSDELGKALADPIRVLISTDVLSEGLNLQDANIIVNYDLHWNPVRLMQRIGRVDRRMDPAKPVRYEKVYVYNFLPPKKDLDHVLGLFKTVTGKLLVINRTLGMEAPVLGPDDQTGAIDFFQNLGDSTMSTQEKLRLIAHGLEQNQPELWEQTTTFPNRVYSGKHGAGKKLFLAYRIPTGLDKTNPEAGATFDVRWFMIDRETEEVTEDLQSIHGAICCIQGTLRNVVSSRTERTRLREKLEEEVIGAMLFRAGIPDDLKPELLCWMEIN